MRAWLSARVERRGEESAHCLRYSLAAMGLLRVFALIGVPVSILASLLILFGLSASSGQGVFLDLTYLGYNFRQIDPYFWSALGVAFAIGLSVLGAAWCALCTFAQLQP